MKRSLLLGLMLCVALSLTAKLNQSIQSADSLNLGSRFYLSLSSQYDLEDAIVPDTLTKFAVLQLEKQIAKGKPVGLKLTIVPLDTGAHTFPAIIVRLAKPVADTLYTRPFTLNIKEIRSPKDTTLVDIAGTEKLKGELPYWAYFVIAGVLLLALLTAIILLIRKYRKKQEIFQPTAPELRDERTHIQRALDALYDLKQENLPRRGELIAFHFRLSEIMKLYLEAEHGFSANEMTTREIKLHFRKQNSLNVEQHADSAKEVAQHSNAAEEVEQNADSAKTKEKSGDFLFRGNDCAEQKDVINWLKRCDKVKFAKHIPDVQACDDKLDWMVNWLLNKNKTPVPAQPEVSLDA